MDPGQVVAAVDRGVTDAAYSIAKFAGAVNTKFVHEVDKALAPASSQRHRCERRDGQAAADIRDTSRGPHGSEPEAPIDEIVASTGPGRPSEDGHQSSPVNQAASVRPAAELSRRHRGSPGRQTRQPCDQRSDGPQHGNKADRAPARRQSGPGAKDASTAPSRSKATRPDERCDT